MNTTASVRIREQLLRTAQALDVTSDDIVALDIELSSILSRIASRTSYADAGQDLDELADLHGLLAILLFKYSIDLTAQQRQVVRTFDRWDDEDTRRHMYNDVRAGRI